MNKNGKVWLIYDTNNLVYKYPVVAGTVLNLNIINTERAAIR